MIVDDGVDVAGAQPRFVAVVALAGALSVGGTVLVALLTADEAMAAPVRNVAELGDICRASDFLAGLLGQS